MSDQSNGPGWWIASDGKWYPPETHPDYVPPLPPPPPSPYATVTTPVTSTSPPKHNWRTIGLIAGGVLLVLIVIGALAGDPDDNTDVAADRVTTTAQSPTVSTLAPAVTQAEPVVTEPPATVPPTTESPFARETVSQRNARQKAADYLDYTAFSRRGLIEQLKYEGFSEADATYGVDALDVDWYEQAAKKAADYLEYTSFSRDGLIEQLMYEGFTREEAEYGVSTTGL
jgi:hypothetical protein